MMFYSTLTPAYVAMRHRVPVETVLGWIASGKCESDQHIKHRSRQNGHDGDYHRNR